MLSSAAVCRAGYHFDDLEGGAAVEPGRLRRARLMPCTRFLTITELPKHQRSLIKATGRITLNLTHGTANQVCDQREFSTGPGVGVRGSVRWRTR